MCTYRSPFVEKQQSRYVRFSTLKKIKMKNFGILITIIIVNFTSSAGNSKCVRRNKEDSLEFNGFINRDNTNITYLTLNNGTEIYACEWVTVLYDCYKNGSIIEHKEYSNVRLIHYLQNENTTVHDSVLSKTFNV